MNFICFDSETAKRSLKHIFWNYKTIILVKLLRLQPTFVKGAPKFSAQNQN